MNRRPFAELLADGLRTLSREAHTPTGLADRALARVRRRRNGVWVSGTVVVAVAASVAAALVVARPPAVFDGGDTGTGGCEPALVTSYLSVPADGSAPTAYVYDWRAAYLSDERCERFMRTRYAWAADNDGRVAVLGRAGDPRGRVSDATRKLGILNRQKHTRRWVELPGPAWAAFWSPWSPNHDSRIVATLVRRGAGGDVVFAGYVIIDPRAAEVTRTVIPHEPALTPFAWTPDGRHVVAAFDDGIRFFDMRGRTTRELSVRGLIPMSAPVSPDGKRILVQPRGQLGSGHYLIVSIADGSVVERVHVDGRVLGWLCGNALLTVHHGTKGTQVFAYDLSPEHQTRPALKRFGPRADVVIPWRYIYEPCQPGAGKPGQEP